MIILIIFEGKCRKDVKQEKGKEQGEEKDHERMKEATAWQVVKRPRKERMTTMMVMETKKTKRKVACSTRRVGRFYRACTQCALHTHTGDHNCVRRGLCAKFKITF